MKITYLKIITNRPVSETSFYLRGYFGNKFRDRSIFHHHLDDIGLIYLYPRIQYKIIEGIPLIVGLSERKKILEEISPDIKELKLNSSYYNVDSIIVKTIEYKPTMTRRPIQYSLITPWIALNQKNNIIYNNLRNFKEKKDFINRILVGNILSFCKGFGIVCNRRLYAHTHIDAEEVLFKGVQMNAFKGKIRMNFDFPDFIGIGKASSFGFGSIQKVINGDSNQ